VSINVTTVYYFQQCKKYLMCPFSFVCYFLFLELIQEFKDMAIVDVHATKSQIQGSKKGWLHPPTSAHSQASPLRQARPQRRARTSLKINDHVSYI
jgi:hypothetical protein